MTNGESGSKDEARRPDKPKLTLWVHFAAYAFISWWGSMIFFAAVFAVCCALIPILGGRLSMAIVPMALATAGASAAWLIFRYRYRSLFERAWRNYRSGNVGDVG